MNQLTDEQREAYEQLRATDAATAKLALELWENQQRLRNDPRVQREEARRLATERSEEHDRRRALARAALAKKFGESAQQLAQGLVLDESGEFVDDFDALETFEMQLRKHRAGVHDAARSNWKPPRDTTKQAPREPAPPSVGETRAVQQYLPVEDYKTRAAGG